MHVKKATFLGSWERSDQMGNEGRAEFAFIGRSNVGKSSLINMLCNHKGLAKTSAQPGKTQTLNLFDIDGRWQICDLPGYGYAKVSKEKRHSFSKMIKHYLQNRKNLVCLFILFDLRILPQKLDLDFINWCGENAIPFVLVGTKADKISTQKVEQSIRLYKSTLSEFWEELPAFYISSSDTGQGKKEILDFVSNCIMVN